MRKHLWKILKDSLKVSLSESENCVAWKSHELLFDFAFNILESGSLEWLIAV